MPAFPAVRVLNVSNNLLSGVVPEALQSSGMFQLVRRPITDILCVLRYITSCVAIPQCSHYAAECMDSKHIFSTVPAHSE